MKVFRILAKSSTHLHSPSHSTRLTVSSACVVHRHHKKKKRRRRKKREEEGKHVPLGSLHLGLRQLVRGALFVVEDQRLLGLIVVGPVLNAARPPHH
jgi:hypothetical protein